MRIDVTAQAGNRADAETVTILVGCGVLTRQGQLVHGGTPGRSAVRSDASTRYPSPGPKPFKATVLFNSPSHRLGRSVRLGLGAHDGSSENRSDRSRQGEERHEGDHGEIAMSLSCAEDREGRAQAHGAAADMSTNGNAASAPQAPASTRYIFSIPAHSPAWKSQDCHVAPLRMVSANSANAPAAGHVRFRDTPDQPLIARRPVPASGIAVAPRHPKKICRTRRARQIKFTGPAARHPRRPARKPKPPCRSSRHASPRCAAARSRRR